VKKAMSACGRCGRRFDLRGISFQLVNVIKNAHRQEAYATVETQAGDHLAAELAFFTGLSTNSWGDKIIGLHRTFRTSNPGNIVWCNRLVPPNS
jgi:hypothetical protein